jgi:hypothetical protein
MPHPQRPRSVGGAIAASSTLTSRCGSRDGFLSPPISVRLRGTPITPDRRLALLTAALGFLQLPPQTSALRALHAWLDNWRGGGHIVVGMERQGLRLSLKKYGNGAGAWVAQFDRDVMTSAEGFGSGPTPWAAVQRAAWVAVKRIA